MTTAIFEDTYQALPRAGYTQMFSRMLGHPNIRVLLKSDYRQVSGAIKFKRLIFTGPIDDYFDFIHGPLPYRSLRFEFRHHKVDRFQRVAQVNYPNEHSFTRITEFRHLTGQHHGGSSIAYEYPQAFRYGQNDPYYPIPRQENRDRYLKYLSEAEQLKGKVVFAGRLADYKYYNMDQAVGRALKVFSSLAGAEGIPKNVSGGLPLPGCKRAGNPDFMNERNLSTG